MNVTGNIMTLAHFADFYYLEALRAGITMAKNANPDNQFRRAVEKLDADVEYAFNSLADTMALRIWVYLWGAALGEVQYAHENCEYAIEEVDGSFSYGDTFEYYPTDENTLMVKRMFGQDWSSWSYGGAKWLQIVEGMELYGKVPNAAFIDHAVDLEHNGGCVFDKTGPSHFKLDCFNGLMDDSRLKKFLDEKFSDDILNTTRTWAVSRKVYSLLVRYSNIIEEISAVDYVRPMLEWLSEYTVTWEDDAYTNEFTRVEANGGYHCENCGDKLTEDEVCCVHDGYYCSDCVERCELCEEYAVKKDTQWIDGEKQTWCDSCAAQHKVTCEECNYDYHNDNMHYTEDDYQLCSDCAPKSHCEHCDEYHYCLDEHIKENHEEEVEEAKHEAVRKTQGIVQLTLLEV